MFIYNQWFPPNFYYMNRPIVYPLSNFSGQCFSQHQHCTQSYVSCSPRMIWRQQLPPVDPAIFMGSATICQSLLGDASRIVNNISGNESFALEVMEAARRSDTAELNRLIANTGVSRQVEKVVNPDMLRLEISEENNPHMSSITISLRWQVPPYV
ncbi:hypothetical protein ACJ2A9_09885 [Anaerobacillus sp. MEB173]|uniref:hypothetical protein n=1 Tax=Anaerobacillus sp. MEB173 TaxID=3383345 RepID=UPI003F928504